MVLFLALKIMDRFNSTWGECAVCGGAMPELNSAPESKKSIYVEILTLLLIMVISTENFQSQNLPRIFLLKKVAS